MKIDLKLDAAAMAALFPENSEARLALQQAVINETVRNLIDRNLSGVRATIDAAVKAQIVSALAIAGLGSKLFGTISLNTETKAQITTAVKDAYSSQIKAAIDAVAVPAVDEMRLRLKTRLEDDLRISVNLMAKNALREALK